MKKYIIMAILSSFIGIFSNPEILSASNSVAVNGLNEAKIVKTEIPAPATVETEVVDTASYDYSYESYDSYYYEPVYEEPQYLSYSVTAYSGSIVVNPSYYDIYKTGGLIYGHNTGDLLYSLNYLYVGDTFIIDGVYYRVSDKVVFDKNVSAGTLECNSYSGCNSNVYNGKIMNKLVKSRPFGHDVALMTCHGQNLGGGDASERLVIFADAI